MILFAAQEPDFFARTVAIIGACIAATSLGWQIWKHFHELRLKEEAERKRKESDRERVDVKLSLEITPRTMKAKQLAQACMKVHLYNPCKFTIPIKKVKLVMPKIIEGQNVIHSEYLISDKPSRSYELEERKSVCYYHYHCDGARMETDPAKVSLVVESHAGPIATVKGDEVVEILKAIAASERRDP